ncbi:jupiter microtubule associated homolog 1-like isoform X1 [Eucyclogobius newberryi]|uniref:jupiter microtubule associated homolog 1-like isoform X1 n=1 Tax=Eucyclogobius newberryi TaxID=166745 RepID=UPI003B5ADBA7
MTTTTTFQGMEAGTKSSSRVLRPPGGETSFSFGSEENTTPRKNKMASNIFAEPDDPHAHRRNNPPNQAGSATGTLCGEPSAPLRRCQQPILFPKNPEPELTTIHNSGAALVWSQKRQENGQEATNDCPDEIEGEQEEHEPNQEKELPQPSAPSGGSSAGGRRNPPGGKSSLILG